MSQRTIVIVPSEMDDLASQKQYYENFVWRVKYAIEKEQIDARIVVVQPDIKA